MTKSQATIWNCVLCGHPNKITVWNSISARLSPELKTSLLENSLLKVLCTGCNSWTKVDYSLLYHDETGRYMIWRIFLDESGIVQGGKDLSLIADSLKNEGYKLRLVNSISELQEKIRIFDNGLDDRVVECLKRLLWEEERVNEAFPYNSVGFSHVETKYGLIDALIIKQVDSNNEALDEFRISYGGSYLPMISMIKRKFHFSEREGVRWKLVDKLYWNLLVKNLDDSRIARV